MCEHIMDTSCPSPHQVAIASMSRLRVMQASDAEDRDIRSDKLKPEYAWRSFLIRRKPTALSPKSVSRWYVKILDQVNS